MLCYCPLLAQMESYIWNVDYWCKVNSTCFSNWCRAFHKSTTQQMKEKNLFITVRRYVKDNTALLISLPVTTVLVWKMGVFTEDADFFLQVTLGLCCQYMKTLTKQHEYEMCSWDLRLYEMHVATWILYKQRETERKKTKDFWHVMCHTWRDLRHFKCQNLQIIWLWKVKGHFCSIVCCLWMNSTLVSQRLKRQSSSRNCTIKTVLS